MFIFIQVEEKKEKIDNLVFAPEVPGCIRLDGSSGPLLGLCSGGLFVGAQSGHAEHSHLRSSRLQLACLLRAPPAQLGELMTGRDSLAGGKHEEPSRPLLLLSLGIRCLYRMPCAAEGCTTIISKHPLMVFFLFSLYDDCCQRGKRQLDTSSSVASGQNRLHNVSPSHVPVI
jgi:hypothetical protein